jgi:uncharacterized protein YfiM (DUF2279 family)
MNKDYSRGWWACMALVAASALAVIVCQPAHADEWTGKDKAQHAQVGALIGGIAAAASQSATVGCVAAGVAGVSKELWDTQRPGHTPSAKDAVVTALAGCFAATFTSFVIGPNRVVWIKEF